MCSRLFSRAFVNGIIGFNASNSSNSVSTTHSNNLINSSELASTSLVDCSRRLKFITAVSGFAKYQSLDVDKTKYGKFGDDAYFLAHYPTKGEVLGM